MQGFVRCFLLSLSLLISAAAYSQVKNDVPFCGKKWFCESTKDGDGTMHPPEKGSENDYMQFLCDNSFVLLEKGTMLKGKWIFDEETAILTLSQTQLTSIPDKFSFHFMEYDDSHLVMIGEEGTKGESTVFLTTK